MISRKFIKILISTIQEGKVLDIMMVDMISNKNLDPVVAALFIRSRKTRNLVFFLLTQSYFPVPKGDILHNILS